MGTHVRGLRVLRVRAQDQIRLQCQKLLCDQIDASQPMRRVVAMTLQRDAQQATLGQALKLPSWEEHLRPAIEAGLEPIVYR